MDNNKLFNNKENCCGCGACYNVCPRQAISMREDSQGFIYPTIDENKCNGCNLCKKVCKYQNLGDIYSEKKISWVAVSKNKEILSQSASGGVFVAIAIKCIEVGGIVFGCAMQRIANTLEPKHISVESKKELYKLQGSKYVQSCIGRTYEEAKNALDMGRDVVFSGTPCQISGLYGYLQGKDYPNLLTIDIICHGVPNAQLFGDYIRFLSQKYKGQVIDFKFRDKKDGWGLNARIDYEKNGVIKHINLPSEYSVYYRLFLKSKIYRDNCYSCPYAGEHRPGDITIGDYWGIESEHPEYLKINGGNVDESKGVSCLIINTRDRRNNLEYYCSGLDMYESEFNKVAKGNAQLKSPSHRADDREELLEIYEKGGYEAIEKWYKKKLGFRYYILWLWNHSPSCLKKVINKLR